MNQNKKAFSSKNAAPAQAADTLLAEIARHKRRLDLIAAAYDKEAELLDKKYEEQSRAHREAFSIAEQSLVRLMKKERNYLFAGGGVLILGAGSLTFNSRDKLKIPKDALEKCEELGFAEAIKIIKQLDREVLEQWPHAKLMLIGADKKTVEEFGYTLKGTGELKK